jgi:hypothetical protein
MQPRLRAHVCAFGVSILFRSGEFGLAHVNRGCEQEQSVGGIRVYNYRLDVAPC